MQHSFSPRIVLVPKERLKPSDLNECHLSPLERLTIRASSNPRRVLFLGATRTNPSQQQPPLVACFFYDQQINFSGDLPKEHGEVPHPALSTNQAIIDQMAARLIRPHYDKKTPPDTSKFRNGSCFPHNPSVSSVLENLNQTTFCQP